MTILRIRDCVAGPDQVLLTKLGRIGVRNDATHCEGRSQELNGDLTWRGVYELARHSNNRLSAPSCMLAVAALLFRLQRGMRLHAVLQKTSDDFNRKGVAASSIFEMTCQKVSDAHTFGCADRRR